MSRTALAVSGGGAKGAFAVGVLKHLYKTYRNIGWFAITGGTSTGALIAPMAALMGAGDPAATEAMYTLLKLYTNVETSDILVSEPVRVAAPTGLSQRDRTPQEPHPLG